MDTRISKPISKSNQYQLNIFGGEEAVEHIYLTQKLDKLYYTKQNKKNLRNPNRHKLESDTFEISKKIR